MEIREYVPICRFLIVYQYVLTLDANKITNNKVTK